MDWTEIAGFVTGAACVWLLVRRNIWNFPIGIANNVLFAVLFLQSGLYADAGLQGVFIVLALIGWATWLRSGGGGARIAVVAAGPRTLAACLAAVAIIWAVLQWGLLRFTDSTVAGWDAVTTALSLVAQSCWRGNGSRIGGSGSRRI